MTAGREASLINTAVANGGASAIAFSGVPSNFSIHLNSDDANTNAAMYGATVYFIDGSAGTPTSTVTFKDGSTKLTKNTTAAVTSGQSVTFTATLAAVSPGAGTPTGTVNFMDNGSSIRIVTVSGGIAMLATTTLPVGSNSITAVYSGDTDFTTSTSNALSQTVNS